MGHVADDVTNGDATEAQDVPLDDERWRRCGKYQPPAETAEAFRGPRRKLALPFVVMGLAAGWMAADFVRAGAFEMDAVVRPALVISVATACAIVGAATGRWLAASRVWAAVGGATLLACAGAVCGAFVAVAYRPSYLVFASQGVAGALLLLPAFLLVGAAVYEVGRVRAGSLLDGVDRRAPWVRVAAFVAAGTIAAVPDWMGFWTHAVLSSVPVSLAIGALGLAIACVLVSLDVAVLLRVRAILSDESRWRARTVETRPEERRLPVLDLGVGGDERELASPSRSAYRDTDHVVGVVRGDVVATRGLLNAAVARGVGAAAVGAACILAALSLPRAHLLARPDLWLNTTARLATASIGVPVCDTYVLEVEACIRKSAPEARDALQAVLDAREGWRRAAATIGGRKALETACANALESLRANPMCR